jgi:prepilin-type N-terminal cleavage/methylation domain-containing protein
MPCRSSIRGLRFTGGSAPRGFSLLEILVVLALFGLVTALMVGGSTGLLKSLAQDDAENVAISAVASARHAAVLAGRTLELRYEEKARVLDWGQGRASITGEDEVRLLPPTRISSVIIGGQLVEAPLARVRFYADGTCDPFRLEIVQKSDRHSRVLTLDPWTCTVLADNPRSR